MTPRAGTTVAVPAPAFEDWEGLAPRAAAAWQRAHAGRVRQEPAPSHPATVAGLDAGFLDSGRQIRAVATLFSFPDLSCLAWRVVTRPVGFPYVPGLLSFREAPALLAALAALGAAAGPPDVVLCDGHGLAHPRRLGVASHVGLVSGLPTIGVAKQRLVGTHDPLPEGRGARRALMHGAECIGEVLRTRVGVRPVYVSVGHRVDLPSATALVLACAPRWRLPDPVHLADRLSRRAGPESWSKVNPLPTSPAVMSEERRNHPRETRVERLLIQIAASDGAPDLAGATLASRTYDVSASGLAVTLERALPQDSHVELWVRIEGDRGKYFLAGTVRWCRPDGGGFLHGIELEPAAGDDLDRWHDRFI